MSTRSNPWRVLVVDDEEGVHGITRMIFRGYEFEGRPIELISALSGREAREQLQRCPDIALVLLDVVMESDSEGLLLVDHIRNELGNRDLRIILRTGHPGYAPETDVIVRYDINDYLSKAELSASRLLTSVVVALRAYRDIERARGQSQPAPGAAATHQEPLLAAAGNSLSEMSAMALRCSQRLLQLELTPMAHDIATQLNALQTRLDNSCRQLLLAADAPCATTTQPVALAPLLPPLVQAFLPLARRQGWLLDYSLGKGLPACIDSDPQLLPQLLLIMLERGVHLAAGEDIRLRLTAQDEQLLISVELAGERDPAAPQESRWQQMLQQNIERLSALLRGEALAGQGAQLLSCRLPL